MTQHAKTSNTSSQRANIEHIANIAVYALQNKTMAKHHKHAEYILTAYQYPINSEHIPFTPGAA